MENDGGTGDDQGSGWSEVKKRHRTSSKFPVQNVVGAFTNKSFSSYPRNQAPVNGKVVNSRCRRHSLPAKAGGNFIIHGKVGGESSKSAAKEAGQGTQCLEKQVIKLEPELPKATSSGLITVTEAPKKENLDKVPKIKWGDLEDDALELHVCRGHSDGASKATSVFIGNDQVAGCEKLGNADGSVSHGCSNKSIQEEKAGLISEDVEQSPGYLGITNDLVLQVRYHDARKEEKLLTSEIVSDVLVESIQENWKEVNEISTKDLLISNIVSDTLPPNNVVKDLQENPEKCLEASCDKVRDIPVSNNSTTENCLSSAVEVGAITMIQVLPNTSDDGTLDISEIPVTSKAVNKEHGCQGSTLQPLQKSRPEASDGAFLLAAAEDLMASPGRSVEVNLSNNQLMGSMEEGESSESKERFRQRLWCFLFENLNRAVDELYLLCELECDVEQMKEATLVLEEAASDFRELKSRVEGFENQKRSSSHLSQDVISVNMKSDHRRPHALSWEVRRMTTSTHRAEILSSSLEAFKKIQHERASRCGAQDAKCPYPACPSSQHVSGDLSQKLPGTDYATTIAREPGMKSRKPNGVLELGQGNTMGEKRNPEASRLNKGLQVQNSRQSPLGSSASDSIACQIPLKDGAAISSLGRCKKEQLGSISEVEKQIVKKDKVLTESKVEKYPKSAELLKRQSSHVDKEKEKRNTTSLRGMDAWKEKRNWEDILASPLRSSSRVSHSPGMSRKSVERARVLHDKLMSPEKKKKTALDMKREAEEKHARAMRIRSELENERVQRLQRTSEKLNRVNEWQAVRSLKLREGMYARHQRSESRHEAYLAQVVRRAGDESSKVNEVRFITSLNEENKKLMLRQKLQDSELRRAEKLQVIRTKQKEDSAREEAVLERRKLLEAEKLQRLAEIQRKKEEAQVRREEERKASSAAREAKAVEQLRRKEVRAKAQQEEAELLAQKLAERLSESEQRRKFYLEQIREKASMDFRDQSSPLLRRSSSKEQARSISAIAPEDYQTNCSNSSLGLGNVIMQHPLKRRIKKIRQRLMALKYEFTEPPVGAESAGIGHRAQVGAARAKIGRWLQDLQRLRQARKEGAASIGLIIGDMIKFLEGKDSELHASRQAGLLDFIASALPASHTSRPEACQVTIYLLRLLRVLLSVPANRSYFLAQNLLPPIIPMLSAALENYIKIAASLNMPGTTTNLVLSKTSVENLESITEVLDGFLWTVTTIIGHSHSDARQLQMRDGLMELVIAYQVIHRLRDLFALYDRPQLEGSPFPSSILLSLNLLAVLTSRSGNVSSINWELHLSRTTLPNKSQEVKITEAAESVLVRDSCVINASGASETTSAEGRMMGDLQLNRPGQVDEEEKASTNGVPVSDVPNDRLLVEPCTNRHGDPLSSGKDSRETPSEFQKNPMEEQDKTSISQKDEYNRTEFGAEESSFLQQITEHSLHIKNENMRDASLNQPVGFLVSAISETGLVSLPSLLTAVLLQANNKLSSEQGFYILPSNFEEVATGVLKVLNNLALLDIAILQSMLARPDLQMEFFHLMSFLLSHSTSKWKAATDQVGLLMLESLLLLGYFALFHAGNQAVLRWGKSPTILHKLCDLPFVFFSDPELTPILAGTLVAACYGCEQNMGVVQQELSMDMLLSLLKSCKQGLVPNHSESSSPENVMTDDLCDVNHSAQEPRKLQGELSVRSSRYNQRSSRVSLGKSSSNVKFGKVKNQRDGRSTKTCDEWALKHNLPSVEPSSTFMLHNRFPSSFIDKAEEFFSAGIQSV